MSEGKKILIFLIVVNFLAFIAILINIELLAFSATALATNILVLPHINQHLKEKDV